VAHRLKAASRESDTLARFGGDEFVLIVEQIDDVEQTREILERTLAVAFDAPFSAGESPVRLSASVGVALGTGMANPERLFADADTAMYEAKRRGGSRVELYESIMTSVRAADVEAD
jgi:diguanylate cyclase (GGDEF)-like protein